MSSKEWSSMSNFFEKIKIASFSLLMPNKQYNFFIYKRIYLIDFNGRMNNILFGFLNKYLYNYRKVKMIYANLL